MDNVILIGMPGAGKSTVGVVLAKRLGYRFVDSDLVIQEREGMLLHQIIEEKGLDGFLKVENEANTEIRAVKSVIATGGSVIYGREAMEHLKRIGLVVYLRLPCASVKERLGDLNRRGVALRDGQTLEDLYEERIPYYERYADITVDCEGRMIRDIAEEIADIAEKSAGFKVLCIASGACDR